MNYEIFALVTLIIVPIVVLSITIPLVIVNKKYENFVLAHSSAIKTLVEINKHYHFNDIKRFDFSHSYDNEVFYDNISTRDYLIYQLVYYKKDIAAGVKDAYGNKYMYIEYRNELTRKCVLNSFDTTDLLKNTNKLSRVEKKLFERMMYNPQTEYSITVYLTLTKINGRYVTSKSNTFYSDEISDLIDGVNDKKNGFYLNQEIWNAICRVERGKVSNKLRFSIYARDGYRCRKCGRKTNTLEIDHIIPIAKGGKTVYENLQTLCHRCNTRKGANIECQNDELRRW